MELGTAVALTLNLLGEHRLLEQGWRVKLARGSGRLGSCYYNKKLIKLARHHVLNGTEAEIIDTIRHEVAHALAGPLAKHGPEWKRWAIRLGCRPRSHAHNITYQMPYKFILHCPVCAKDIQKRRVRVSMRRLQTLYHPQCGKQTIGRLILRRYVNES
jgi:predicted SprT family Zn-dependent metalloprotease